VQRRERQLHLRLHSGDAAKLEAGGVVRAVAEEAGLADPGFTADHQNRTMAASCFSQEAVQDVLLARTSEKDPVVTFAHAEASLQTAPHDPDAVRRRGSD
jgi:hypothetical protein